MKAERWACLSMRTSTAAWRSSGSSTRGNTTGGRHSDGTYNQDDKSVFEQTTMEGHSVRSVLLAAGVVKAASINGRADYADTGKRWFDNMVDAKMYITGGLGAIPSIEGFGPDYELPNTGYAETCAAVAGGFFGHEMNLSRKRQVRLTCWKRNSTTAR